MARKAVGLLVLFMSIFIAYQYMDKFDPKTVKGKNVIISGASTGIGEQLAYHYARLGANIVITARNEQLLQQVIEKCKDIGDRNGQYHYISLDMIDQESPAKLINYAAKVLQGRIDYVVLNHVFRYHFGEWLGSAENFTSLKRTFSVNFHSYVGIASQAMHHLELSRGSIIVVSSIAGKFVSPNLVPYITTKHALQVCK